MRVAPYSEKTTQKGGGGEFQKAITIISKTQNNVRKEIGNNYNQTENSGTFGKKTGKIMKFLKFVCVYVVCV